MSEVTFRAALRGWSNLQRLTVALAAVIALLLGLSSPLMAQVNNGRISGEITDQTGGAVAGAKITVTDVARGESRALASDADGEYAAPNLTPGIYTVHVEFMGFETVDRQNVEVQVGGDVRVDVTLQPGAQTQTVTVTESIPVVNTTNAQTGGVLETNLIEDLPLNGRNYRAEQQLIPGVMLGFGTSALTVDVNGTTDDHASDTLLDGLYDQTYFTGEVTFGGSGEAGTTTLLPLDAIDEINLVVNPKAEYGWVPGVTSSIGLKSGTNSMHGDAYAFGRDTALDARNAFSTVTTPVEFEQYGATLGGPIKKNRVFYFLGYESFLEDADSIVGAASYNAPSSLSGAGTSASIPDAIAAMNTAGHPLNTLSLNLAGCNVNSPDISSHVGATVALACTANQYGAPGLWVNPNLGIIPDDGHSYNGIGKIDFHINDHHTLSGSFGYGTYEENAAGNSASKITQSYWEEILGATGNQGRISEIWTPNSTWLNEARWGRDENSRPVGRAECSPNGSLANPAGVGASTGGFGGPNYLTQYGLLSGAPGCGIPTITLSGIGAQLGFSNDRTDLEVDEQGADVLSYTRGKHQFKFGLDIRAIDFTGAKELDSQSGTIAFGGSGAAAFSGATALESFLSGVPSAETIASGSPQRSISSNLIALFAQDDWRILPRLTLNLGLREEIVTPPTSPTNNLGNFNPSAPLGISAESQAWNTQHTTEPRIGFAWDITGKGTTTLRAGGGVLRALITLMNFISGQGSTIQDGNLDAVPTGETMYSSGGTIAGVAPGNGRSAIITSSPVSNSSGVVTSSPIIWPTTATATTPLFPTLPAVCGNGLPIQGPGTTPTGAFGTTGTNPLNPSPCAAGGADPNFNYYEYTFWNINLEHAFTNTFSIDIGYVGTKSTGVLQNINLNQPAPTDVSGQNSPSAEQLREPYFNATNNALGVAFPWLSTIEWENSAGIDNFRSLQVSATKRVSRGFSATLAYTFAGNYLSQGPLNIHIPVAGTDGPYSANTYPLHHLSISATYALPSIKSPGQMLSGWSASTSINILSAVPVTVLDTKDDLTGAGTTTTGTSGVPWTLYGPAAPFSKLFGRAGVMPCYGVSGVTTSSLKSSPCIQVPEASTAAPWGDLPAACIAGAESEAAFPGATAGTSTQNGLPLYQLATIGCYMSNGSAIVPPAQGTYGTMLPDAIKGPGQSVVNASVSKDWKFKERFDTQFRFEIFNLFNRTQYSGGGTNLGAPTSFALATNTPDVTKGDAINAFGGPRYIQFGLKLLF